VPGRTEIANDCADLLVALPHFAYLDPGFIEHGVNAFIHHLRSCWEDQKWEFPLERLGSNSVKTGSFAIALHFEMAW
jgi:hypothetical protein